MEINNISGYNKKEAVTLNVQVKTWDTAKFGLKKYLDIWNIFYAKSQLYGSWLLKENNLAHLTNVQSFLKSQPSFHVFRNSREDPEQKGFIFEMQWALMI